VESLYLSPALAESLHLREHYPRPGLSNWLSWRRRGEQTKTATEFVELCKSVTAKRPKTVIDHILKNGFITTQELKDTYGV